MNINNDKISMLRKITQGVTITLYDNHCKHRSEMLIYVIISQLQHTFSYIQKPKSAD